MMRWTGAAFNTRSGLPAIANSCVTANGTSRPFARAHVGQAGRCNFLNAGLMICHWRSRSVIALSLARCDFLAFLASGANALRLPRVRAWTPKVISETHVVSH